MTQLTKYDAARNALAEAHRVDEVKDILDKSIAMQAYARQAKDEQLIQHATEMRMRAERRIGEMMREAKALGQMQTGGDARRQAIARVADGPEQNVPPPPILQTPPPASVPPLLPPPFIQAPHIAPPLPPAPVPSLKDIGIDKHLADRARKAAALSSEEFETKLDRTKEKAVSAISGIPVALRGTTGTGENEWYTPQAYIEAARTVLGTIDLDPATSKFAQSRVKAEEFFTIDDNGLSQSWVGNVWLNPPYAQPAIAQFVAKMVEEVRAMRVTAAIMLTHNYTDTSWFHSAAGTAAAICFTRGRVKFEQSDGTVAAPTQGQAFFYFGEDVAAFRDVFGAIGFVVTL